MQSGLSPMAMTHRCYLGFRLQGLGFRAVHQEPFHTFNWAYRAPNSGYIVGGSLATYLKCGPTLMSVD